MILLFSGGIDSYIGWHYLKEPKTVYFDLHTPYSSKEKKVVQSLLPNTIVEDTLDLGNRQIGESAYIPFRNLYLAMLASSYDDEIVICGLKDDKVSDKNEQIFEKMSNILSEMENREIKIISPFWHMTKEQIINWFVHKYDGSKLLKTISCYSYDDTNYCGKCKSCFRKWCALYVNSIQLQFYNKPLMLEYLRKAEKGYYDKSRNETIIYAITDYLGYRY